MHYSQKNKTFFDDIINYTYLCCVICNQLLKMKKNTISVQELYQDANISHLLKNTLTQIMRMPTMQQGDEPRVLVENSSTIVLECANEYRLHTAIAQLPKLVGEKTAGVSVEGFRLSLLGFKDKPNAAAEPTEAAHTIGEVGEKAEVMNFVPPTEDMDENTGEAAAAEPTATKPKKQK